MIMKVVWVFKLILFIICTSYVGNFFIYLNCTSFFTYDSIVFLNIKTTSRIVNQNNLNNTKLYLIISLILLKLVLDWIRKLEKKIWL